MVYPLQYQSMVYLWCIYAVICLYLKPQIRYFKYNHTTKLLSMTALVWFLGNTNVVCLNEGMKTLFSLHMLTAKSVEMLKRGFWKKWVHYDDKPWKELLIPNIYAKCFWCGKIMHILSINNQCAACWGPGQKCMLVFSSIIV